MGGKGGSNRRQITPGKPGQEQSRPFSFSSRRQSLGLYYTALRAGHTGPFTRLMACDDPKAPGKDVIPDTFVHKNYAVHPRTGDAYGGYNKAAAYGIWLNHTTPQADYVAILDSDMTIRHPITVSNTGVAKGKPVSAYYGYLKGVHPSINLPVKKGLRKHHNAQVSGGHAWGDRHKHSRGWRGQ